MLANREQTARLQSDFYRNQFRKILRWLIVSVFIIFVLIAAIIYFILFEVDKGYSANTSEGKILPMPSHSHTK